MFFAIYSTNKKTISTKRRGTSNQANKSEAIVCQASSVLSFTQREGNPAGGLSEYSDEAFVTTGIASKDIFCKIESVLSLRQLAITESKLNCGPQLI
jgi:hypothetical protein